MLTSFIFRKMYAKYPVLSHYSLSTVVSFFFQVKMVLCEKTAVSPSKSITLVLFFETITILGTWQVYFTCTSHFITQKIKKMCTQGRDLIK